MDKVREDILRFELMLRGDPEQKTRGCSGLRVIAEQMQGTLYAKRAKQILDSNCTPRGENDPEFSAFTVRWIAIHSLTDLNLPIVLRDLQARPAVAARLRREIIKDLQHWISEILPRVGPQTPPEEIDALNKFATIPALTTYEAELDELRQLRNRLFELRYEKARNEITNALNIWSFDEAWSAFQQLANAPANFEKAVTDLQDEIYKANRKNEEVERLLDQSLQHEPADWTEAASVISYVQQLSDHLNQEVPEEWRRGLAAAKQSTITNVTRFLENQALKLRGFHEIRAFQANFDNLHIDDRQTGLSLNKEWFQGSIDLLTQDIKKDVAEAASPEALDVILMGLIDKQAGLSEIFVDEINAWRIRIDELSTTWKLIRTGDDFPLRIPSGEPLPEVFVEAVKFFKERLNRVNDALAKLDADDTDSIQKYIEAGETAREILEELGHHATAIRLKEKAERKIAFYQINDAITGWQIDRLLKLCRLHNDETECNYYLANEHRLYRLEALTKESDFSGSPEAARWWQLWRSSTEELPANVPEALNLAIVREQENRADQWHAVLGVLSESPLSPERCDEIAASLKHELTRLDLKWRQIAFLHKAGAGYAERFIKSKQWRLAEKKILELDQEHESTRWLKTLLAVERARESGVLALSQVLKSDWSQVSIHLKDDAHSILTLALARAWEDKEDEALKNLRMVVTRLLTTRQAPPELLKTLEQWEEWLTVESYVRTTGGMPAVKKLVSYLERQVPGDKLLAQRLERLIDYWQEQKDLVMLAWAYEAFRDHVSLPIRLPIEDFEEQITKLAAEYENELRHNEQLELAAVKTMQLGLKQAETEWARLTEYLNEIPHPTTTLTIPVKFYNVRELLSLVDEIWTDLDELRNADLRLPAERARLEACRRTLQGKFEGIVLQARLLQQERELEPLTSLPYFQNRIVDAADNCGNDELWDEENLFRELADSVNNMISLFRRVGAEYKHLWRLISAEYCITIHARAVSFFPKPSPPDLAALAAQFADLQTEEETLAKLWRELKNSKPIVPSGSAFEPEAHLEYLKRFPKGPPHSRRAYIQFKRNFAAIEPMPTILSQSRRYLPEWICKYLDEGIPQYSTEV
ncbi:MAG TPA: hypothetical protein VF290_18265 [Pyrinomonadaceae bacterium]